MKILAQIEKRFCGGRVGGGLEGGKSIFLKFLVIVKKMSQFCETRMCRFFKLLKKQNFHFAQLGQPCGQFVDYFEFKLLGSRVLI
jgi:hypothetical protein